MHVALIANTAWLDEDLAMLHYLVVGLMDEQVRVVQVLPERRSNHQASGFCDRVSWQDSRWKWVRRRRLSRALGPLKQLGVDVIHALDGRIWDGAVSLARRLWTPIVLGSSSASDVARIDRLHGLNELVKVVFVATTGPIAAAIQKKIDPDVQVETMLPGVHVPEAPTVRRVVGGAESSPLYAAVTGNGTYDAQYEALLIAIQSIVTQYPQAQFFFDGQVTDQRLLWQAAKRYRILSNVSFVPRRTGHRELLLRADVLIQPQALGQSRMLTLQAMAHGVPVMALADPWLDYLVDQETAWVIQEPDPALWRRQIQSYIQDPRRGQELTRRVRPWIRKRHLAAQQVDHVLRLYRQITGESIKFPRP